ncbi:IBR domain protein [Oesophagostomum dentatum]|uniref:E3 ubiquitin-protein ligase parkin n=1 Tax=Oesophagostomum dentatum TaxID=61180 RepID=A0A0B1TRQ4_OESDE|nr:IBR domain protein [Oesophagostomum dentatum]
MYGFMSRSLIVFVENRQPFACSAKATSTAGEPEPAVARATPEIGSFYVWCKSCSDIRRGKLRVYCSACSSSAVLVKTEPSCWKDVTRSNQIEVTCAECKSTHYAVFRFKCIKCNEVGAVLSHIRGNWEHVQCSVCLDEHTTYLFDFGCHHMVCRQCFVECLTLALEESRFIFRPPFGYTITCPYPGCERCVADVHHFHVLGDEKYQRYQKLATEKLVAMDDQGVFCPYPDCNASFFWEVEDDDGKTLCPECLRLFCRLCKSADCVCGVDDPTEVTIKATTKKCPGCGANTERNEGCAHIHCIVCKMDWCFGHSPFLFRLCKSADCVCGVDDPTEVTIKATTKKCPGCGANTERNEGCAHIHCIVCKMDWCFVCVAPWTEDCQWNHWFS